MPTREEITVFSRAPVRLDIAGGWTDIPFFSDTTPGAVTNLTINRYTYATLRLREDDAVTILSADFDTSVEVKNFREIEYDGNLDLVKAAIRRLDIRRGMDLAVRCEAPPGSGLGTSASVSVALIGLLNALHLERLSPHEIAKLARKLEVEELGIAVGKQDQYASALGGVNFMEFDREMVNVSSLRLEHSAVLDLEKHLVLCYTGKSRLSGDLLNQVESNVRKGVRKTLDALGDIAECAVEMKSALLAGKLTRVGELMLRNWTNQKALHPSITNPQIERLFRAALDAGAVGGKACGAGGGGCVVFLAEPDREHEIHKALTAEKVEIIPFNIDFEGLATWTPSRES